MSSIEKARNGINAVDQKMLELFKERMQYIKEVLAYKQEHGLKVTDVKRELEILTKNIALLNNPELEEYYLIFFEGVLKASKKYQEDHYE